MHALVDAIAAQVLPTGGWSYAGSSRLAAEPTCLAILALQAAAARPDLVLAARCALHTQQDSSGAVRGRDDLPEPRWTTALAVLAWLPSTGADEFAEPRRRAVDWLLRASGSAVKVNAPIRRHDTELVGWSWIDGTHSWLEPTAYAVLALRRCGLVDHPRTRQGVRLILDRGIPSGGWNYGNSEVLENELRPFAETTGIALFALAGEPRAEPIDAAVRVLHARLPDTRAPLALGWGLLGLSAWSAAPSASADWLAATAANLKEAEPDPLAAAVLLWAWTQVAAPVGVESAAP